MADELAVGRWLSRPVAVEAVQLTADANWYAIAGWCGGWVRATRGESRVLVVPTDTGWSEATEGYWIICGTQGEFYPCLDSVFRRKYVSASDERAWDEAVAITATRETWQGIVNSIYQAKQEYATSPGEEAAFDADAALIENALGADR
jgi:hypothetical protein